MEGCSCHSDETTLRVQCDGSVGETQVLNSRDVSTSGDGSEKSVVYLETVPVKHLLTSVSWSE